MESVHTIGFCRGAPLWHAYNSRLKPNSCYDYFYNDILASKVKPYHFDPAFSQGNIEQVYGKLHPTAVHHTSVMAFAFTIGVWVRVGESFMGSFTKEVKGHLTLDIFSCFFWARVMSQNGCKLAPVVLIHDIARFNAISRMLRSLFSLAFCKPGSSQALMCVRVCVCDWKSK